MKYPKQALLALLSALAASAALAQAAAPLTEGEIRKVDREAGKLTIKHGEIKNLEMPPMTMGFRVSDPRLLESVNVGDQVGFHTEKVDGQFTVTAIEKKVK